MISGIIIGILISILVVVSNRRWNVYEKFTQKTEVIIPHQKAKIVELPGELESKIDEMIKQ